MQVNPDETFNELATQICRDDLGASQLLLERVEIVRKTASTREDPTPVDEFHGGLLPYLGAAYYLHDADSFRKGVIAFQALSVWYAENFAPSPWQLLADLCIAVITGPAQTRQALVKAVLWSPEEVRQDDAFGTCARIIAAASDMDRALLIAEAGKLLLACRNGYFSRRNTGVYRAFGLTAMRLGQESLGRVQRSMSLMDRRHAMFTPTENSATCRDRAD